MNPKTKKKVIIGISVATILGVASYFLYKWLKDTGKIGKKKEDEEDVDDKSTVVYVTKKNTIAPPSSPSKDYKINRPSDVLTFQKWVIETKGDKTILGAGGESGYGDDGLWGPKSQNAWKKYKKEYNKTPDEVASYLNKLTGQLKVIYDRWKSANVKDLQITKGSTSGKTYVCAKGSVTGNRYCYGEGGTWYAYNSKGTRLGSGNFSNDGKLIVCTQGPGKGKTFTGKTAMSASVKAVTDPESVVNLSTIQVADIVAKMYDAMKGVGTKNITFNKQWDRMKTLADFNKVNTTFGTKDGENLEKWMKGEEALRNNKSKYRNWLKSVGYPKSSTYLA